MKKYVKKRRQIKNTEKRKKVLSNEIAVLPSNNGKGFPGGKNFRKAKNNFTKLQ